jgi:hypothetical protein
MSTLPPWVFTGTNCGLLIALSAFLISCVPAEERRAFPGEYAYRGRLGQVESLTINSDGTFRHELYDDEATFVSHGHPLFALEGHWTFENNKTRIKLLNLGLISVPVRITGQPGEKSYDDLPWNSRWEGAPAILFGEDSFYWLVKLKERKDIRTAKFRYR